MLLKKVSGGVFLMVVVITIFGVVNLALAQTKDVDKTVIRMTDDGFDPQSVNITLGQTVVFENTGGDDHWPASNIHPTHEIYPEFDPKRPIPAKQTWEFKFDRAGIWKFHDHLYPQFGGTVTVKEEGAKTGPATSQPKTQSRGFLRRIFDSIASLFGRLFGSKTSTATPAVTTKPERQSALPSASAFLPLAVESMQYQEPLSDEKPATQQATTKNDVAKSNIKVAKDSTEIFNNDDMLSAYVKEYGPGQTIAHLAELQSQFGSCHAPAHKAGHFAYQFFEKNAFSECSSECQSGCYHGAMEEFFSQNGTANLAENIRAMCGTSLNSFIEHQCIHGLGHGIMAWTNYDLPEALKDCDLLTSRQDSCYTGVFMENIVGGVVKTGGKKSEPGLGDHFTKYLSDDPQYPCNAVDDKYKWTCYFLQTSRTRVLFHDDFKKVADACAAAPSSYQNSCFSSMGRDVAGVREGNPELAITRCGYAPQGEKRIACLNGAVQDAFWDKSGADKALNFCKLLSDKKEKDSCYQTIFGRAPDVIGGKLAMQNFCSKAEADYRASCLPFP